MSYSMSLNAGQKQAQSLKQSQRLIMSPQMQQAIGLLQLPVMELSHAVEAELEVNPILEWSEETELSNTEQEETASTTTDTNEVETEISFEDQCFDVLKHLDQEFHDHFAESGNYATRRTTDDEKLQSYLESSIVAETSLFEHLMEQAQQTFETPEERNMAEAILGNLDEQGFLTSGLQEISALYEFPLPQLEKLLQEIQTFEPYGVGAHDIRESLIIQLRCLNKQHTLAYQIIENHYDDLLHNRIPVIQKGLRCTAQEIRDAIDQQISRLDLHPGVWHAKHHAQAIIPDVTISDEDETLTVHVVKDKLPSFRINTTYLRLLETDSISAEEKEYIKQKILSGKWLLRNIDQRNMTIFRITELLIDKQRDFFSNPEGHLQPLTMKAVSEELDLHESTIARAVANKYVDSPRGLLPLRTFFTNAYNTEGGEIISANTVKGVVKKIIDEEDKTRPLSDEVISGLVTKHGVQCARRTVAKYRRELNLGNASQRRVYQ